MPMFNIPLPRPKAKPEILQHLPAVTSYSYIPINPIPISKEMVDSQGHALLCARADLPSVYIYSFQKIIVETIDAEGKISYLAGSAEARYQKAKLYVENVRYIPIPFDVDPTAEGRKLVTLMVGYGARATVEYTSKNAKISTGSLFPLGAEASAGNVSGNICLMNLGISGKSVFGQLEIGNELNADSLLAAIKQIKAIQILGEYDENSVVVPSIIGIDPRGVAMDKIMDEVFAAMNSIKMVLNGVDLRNIVVPAVAQTIVQTSSIAEDGLFRCVTL